MEEKNASVTHKHCSRRSLEARGLVAEREEQIKRGVHATYEGERKSKEAVMQAEVGSIRFAMVAQVGGSIGLTAFGIGISEGSSWPR